jgi:hypothetical protein
LSEARKLAAFELAEQRVEQHLAQRHQRLLVQFARPHVGPGDLDRRGDVAGIDPRVDPKPRDASSSTSQSSASVISISWRWHARIAASYIEPEPQTAIFT